MSGKPVHVVFQVLNFIHSDLSKDYPLLPIDKLILINLASHRGKLGICPSIRKVAQELGISTRYAIERIDHLQSINLLQIDKSHGIRNRYHLNIISPSGEPQFTSDSQFTSEPQITAPVNCGSKSGEPQFTRVVSNNKRSNREREPLSFFEPDEQSKALASRLELNLDEELKSFTARHKGDKSQYEFERWLKNSREYKNKHNGHNNEVRCNLKFWEPGNPDYDRVHGLNN